MKQNIIIAMTSLAAALAYAEEGMITPPPAGETESAITEAAKAQATDALFRAVEAIDEQGVQQAIAAGADITSNASRLQQLVKGIEYKWHRVAMCYALQKCGVEMPREMLLEGYRIAAYEAMHEWLELALKAGADPKGVYKEEGTFKAGEPLVLLAAIRGDCHYVGNRLEALRVMLRYGADPHACAVDGTPLITNVPDGSEVRLLLEYGADPNAIGSHGMTPLLKSYWDDNQQDSAATVEALLKAGANPNVRSDDGRTPLMAQTNSKAVQLLLAAGADPNARDNEGRTPLMYATSAESAKALLAAGADPHATDNRGNNVLLRLMEKGPANETISLLLSYGLDPNAKRFSDDRTVLDLVMNRSGYKGNIIPELLAAGADWRQASTDLIASGVSKGLAEQMESLLEHGCQMRPETEASLLELAIDSNRPAMADFALRHGKDINAPLPCGMPPLLYATKRDMKMVARLLELGARADAQDFLGRNVMHLLARKYACPSEELFALFTACGGDINLLDKGGNTPLDYFMATEERFRQWDSMERFQQKIAQWRRAGARPAAELQKQTR